MFLVVIVWMLFYLGYSLGYDKARRQILKLMDEVLGERDDKVFFRLAKAILDKLAK